jgi:hypothetical protein
VQSYEFRWASTNGALGLPHPEELEYLGYEYVRDHTIFPDSKLYRRPVPLQLSDSGRYGGVHPPSPEQLSGRSPVDKSVGDEDEEKK